MLAHCRTIVDATDLPVSADLADGLAGTPEAVTETYRFAAATGLVGASIEDARGDGQLYPIDAAAERVRAAVAGVRALPFPFTLTARAENYLVGNPDLADTIARLQAHEEAGADVLYAPGLKSTSDIAAIVAAIGRPLNVIAGAPGLGWSVDELAALGVKRISTGAALARAALTGFLAAAREMQDDGTFSFADGIVSGREVNAMFSP